MHITFDYHLKKLKEFKDFPKRWEFRYYKKKLDEHVSGLRLTAQKLKGTSVARWCTDEANRFEREMKKILEK